MKPVSTERLAGLNEFLSGFVRGQPHAIKLVSGAVQRAELGLAKAGRPKGSFLFLGPTGVGKTETAKGLSRFLLGSDKDLVRFDMAEYQEKSSIKQMLGASKQEQGLLGDALEQNPDGGILLLDEIEKAHPDISTLFLAVLDDARITMSTGKTYDLTQWYVIVTSNLGSGDAIKMDSVPYTTLSRHVLNVATEHFRPEVLARFQERIVFNRLTLEIQKELANTLIVKEVAHIKECLRQKMAERNALAPEVTYEPDVVSFIIRKGYSRLLGARPMRDAVEREMQGAIATWLLGMPQPPSEVRFAIIGKELGIETKEYAVAEYAA